MHLQILKCIKKYTFLIIFTSCPFLIPIIHKNIEFEPPYLPWAINANHGTFFKKHIFHYLDLNVKLG